MNLAKPPLTPFPANPGLEWLSGGGELGNLISQFDWARTPLGPLYYWPQSLRTAVSLMLSSRHPMWIGWGPEATFLYNDAYISVLSRAKHPWALGRPAAEVWAEIWDVCGPLADKVFQKGEASFVDDVQLFMKRGDFIEETYYSFSYSPIRDESGRVGGLFCPAAEVSAKVLNARRLNTLSELSANSLVEKTVEGACASAFRALAENPHDVPFVLLYLLDGPARARCAATAGLRPEDQANAPAEIDLQDPHPILWPVKTVVDSAQGVVVPVAAVLTRGAAGQPIKHALVLPVTSRGNDQPLGVLIAGVSPTRQLDQEYRTFYELMAGQLATAIQNARAAEDDKRRAEELTELDRAKTTFLSNVSHELRTPLTLMLGPLEEIANQPGENGVAKCRELAAMAHRSGLRLLKLVNTLLDFSRIEAGRTEASFMPTELGVFTAELASAFRSAIEKAGLKLLVDCPPLREPAYVDRDFWEKIVLNLLSNAYKFTLQGEISVSLREEQGSIRFSVQDTGTGIAAAAKARLFERFYRVEEMRGRSQEGTGIGLALVKDVVKLHGGSMEAESEVGVGSTFTVIIPTGSAHLPPDRVARLPERALTAIGPRAFVEEALRWNSAEAPKPAREAGAGTAPKSQGWIGGRVLLVDDNADMRDYVHRLLVEHFDVMTASDGQEALELLEREPADLILTDVMMPRIDGFGLVKAIREHPAWRTLPIILLSARAGEGARVEGIGRDADDYLAKPFSASELIARVTTHLELARVRREADGKVRETEARFRLALEAADVGTWDWDIKTGRAEWSKRTRAILGGDEPGVEDGLKQFLACVHLDDRQRVQDEVRLALEDGEDYASELRVVRPDGEQRWISTKGKLFRDDAGKPTRMLGALIDVTERRRREQSLRDTRARLQATLDAAAVGTWTWDLTRNRLFADASVFKMFSFPCSEEEMAPVDELLSAIHPDDLSRVQRALERALRRETETFEEDYRVVQTDGSCRWVASRGRYSSDSPEAVPVMSGVLIDITERKKIEDALRRREELISTIIDQSPVGTFLLDPELRIQHVNPQAQPVFSELGDVRGRHLRDVVGARQPADVAKQIIEHFERTLATGEPYHVSGYAVRQPGDAGERFYDWEIHRVPLPEGRHGVVCYFVEITAHVISQRNLRESSDRLEVALGAAKLGLWSWDAATDLIDFPDRAAEIFGVAPGRTMTWTALQGMLDSEDAIRARTAVEAAIASKQDYDIEYRVTRPDGTPCYVAAKGRTVLGSDGKVSGMIGVVQDITARKLAEQQLAALLVQEREAREEAEALSDSARALSSDLDLHNTVQKATDTATRLTGANFGAFFYNLVNERQESYVLYAFSGVPREAFAEFGLPRNTAVFAPTFRGEGVVRVDDIMADPRYGKNDPYLGMPKGHLPARSYLALPVISRSGEVLGGMFFGHPDVGVFNARSERVAVGIASQAAIAIDNAKLYQRVQTTVDRLNFSLASLQLGDWRWDAETDIMTLSPRTIEIYGFPPDTRDKREALRAAIHPEDRDRARAAAKRSFETATDYDVEYRVVHPQRGVRWIVVKGRSVFDADKRTTGMMGVVQDITERKQAELHLRSQRDVLEQIVTGRALPEILESLTVWVERFAERKLIATILLMEEDGRHLRAGAGRSCPAEWSRYVDGIEIGPEAGSCGTAAYLRETVVVTDVANDFRWAKFKGEALRHGLRACWSSPVRAADGSVLGTFAVYYLEPTAPTAHEREIVDVVTRTASIAIERKRAEEALKQSGLRLQEHAEVLERTVAERTAKLRETIGELEAFSYSISHDMRAPLRSMYGYAELVLKENGPKLDSDGVQYLKRISKNAARLELLVRDVLAYSKVAKEDVQLTKVDLDTFVPWLVGQMPELQRPDIKVTVQRHLPAVLAHEAYLSQIFTNLVGNAIKFSRPGTQAEVEIAALTSESGMLKITVADNGVGIDSAHYSRIFEIFGRVYPDKKYEGTGIGLSIVKKAVQRMGGTIGVESTLGKGTKFWFTLKLS